MDLNLLQNLIGNLDLGFDFSKHQQANGAQGSQNQIKQKNKLKSGTQVVININGVVAERRAASDAQDTSGHRKGYCAVFLTNNQVYFGRLGRMNTPVGFVRLQDVYYLREVTDEELLNVDLIRLGSELHAPEREMIINLSAILFWERLQDNGPIVTAITNYSDDK